MGKKVKKCASVKNLYLNPRQSNSSVFVKKFLKIALHGHKT